MFGLHSETEIATEDTEDTEDAADASRFFGVFGCACKA
jgi:hypothetical protein